MAVVLIFEAPGITATQYDSVNQELQRQGLPMPNAMLTHIAAPTDDGWTVIELWESPEAAREFSRDLFPVLRQCGIDVDKYPPKILPVHAAFSREVAPAMA